MVIANNAGTISLKLTTTGAVADGTMLRVAAPVSAGRSSPASYVYAGTLDSAGEGDADITAQYVAKYGVPPIGSKVFVSVNQNSNGWEDIPHTFVGIVPDNS